MKMDKVEYRIFDGEEYHSDGTVYSENELNKAIEDAMWWQKRVKEAYPDFPFKYKIVKVQGGFKLFTNNTVRNMKNF